MSAFNQNIEPKIIDNQDFIEMMFDLEIYEEKYPNFNYLYNSVNKNGEIDKIYKWIENITQESESKSKDQQKNKSKTGDCLCMPLLKCFKIKKKN